MYEEEAMKQAGLISVLALMLGFSPLAHGALVNNGGGFIYNTDLNITWYDVPAVDTWGSARTWAADLRAGGLSGWRLPTTPITTTGLTTQGDHE